MSEKRFEVDIDHLLLVWDTEKNKRLEIEDIVDLLNRQDYAIEVKQKYIEKLEKQLEQIPKSIREVWLE